MQKINLKFFYNCLITKLKLCFEMIIIFQQYKQQMNQYLSNQINNCCQLRLSNKIFKPQNNHVNTLNNSPTKLTFEKKSQKKSLRRISSERIIGLRTAPYTQICKKDNINQAKLQNQKYKSTNNKHLQNLNQNAKYPYHDDYTSSPSNKFQHIIQDKKHINNSSEQKDKNTSNKLFMSLKDDQVVSGVHKSLKKNTLNQQLSKSSQIFEASKKNMIEQLKNYKFIQHEQKNHKQQQQNLNKHAGSHERLFFMQSKRNRKPKLYQSVNQNFYLSNSQKKQYFNFVQPNRIYQPNKIQTAKNQFKISQLNITPNKTQCSYNDAKIIRSSSVGDHYLEKSPYLRHSFKYVKQNVNNSKQQSKQRINFIKPFQQRQFVKPHQQILLSNHADYIIYKRPQINHRSNLYNMEDQYYNYSNGINPNLYQNNSIEIHSANQRNVNEYSSMHHNNQAYVPVQQKRINQQHLKSFQQQPQNDNKKKINQFFIARPPSINENSLLNQPSSNPYFQNFKMIYGDQIDIEDQIKKDLMNSLDFKVLNKNLIQANSLKLNPNNKNNYTPNSNFQRMHKVPSFSDQSTMLPSQSKLRKKYNQFQSSGIYNNSHGLHNKSNDNNFIIRTQTNLKSNYFLGNSGLFSQVGEKNRKKTGDFLGAVDSDQFKKRCERREKFKSIVSVNSQHSSSQSVDSIIIDTHPQQTVVYKPIKNLI